MAADAPTHEAWTGSPGARPGVFRERRHEDLPGPLETLERVPRSSTPVLDQGSTPLPPSPFAFRLIESVGQTRRFVFRSSITRPTFSLRTLRRHGYPCSTQHSLPGGGVTLPGRDSHPLGSVAEFLSWVSYILDSLQPELAWRTDEVERVEKHGMRAVAPSSLESLQQALAIGCEFEAFLRYRRPRDVPTQPLESATISAVDRRPACTLTPPTSASASPGAGTSQTGCTSLRVRWPGAVPSSC
jgi:hypothetical protein